MFSAEPLHDDLQTLNRSERYNRTRQLLSELDESLDKLDFCSDTRAQIAAARDLSLCAHFHQSDRADGQPYINHPLEVTLTMIQRFGFAKPEAIIAALLHDTIEDQAHRLIELLGTTPNSGVPACEEGLRLIGRRFGARAAEMVSRLTNPDFHELSIAAQLRGDPRSLNELTCHFYKEHFIEIFEQDPEAFLIKLSDFAQNALALGSLTDGAKKISLKSKYGPVLLTLAERLQALPPEGHVLTPWRDTLATEILWVYARDYSS